MEFTSNANSDFEVLRDWQDRVDVIIDKGLLQFVTYHKNQQAAFFQDGSKFFPPDFRNTIRKRMHAKETDE